MTESIHVEDRAAAAADLLHPMRNQILHELSHQPDSAAGLAARLGIPRQKLNYHVRQLEDDGLLHLVETRKRRNMEERIFETAASAFLISPEALGDLSPQHDSSPDQLSARYLLSLAAKLIRELGANMKLAKRQDKKVGVLGMETQIRFSSAAQRKAFSEELVTVVSELVTRYHDAQAEGGRAFELMLGIYPSVTRKNQDTVHIHDKN